MYLFTMAGGDRQITDTLPRASIQQLLAAIRVIGHMSTPASFEAVRIALVRQAERKSPASADAKWTTARDVLSDLERAGYVSGGPIPRQRTVLERLRHSTFELTDQGKALAETYETNRGAAFDEMLLTWLRQHPYFRAYVGRIARAPLHIPDITSIKDLNGKNNNRSPEALAPLVVQTCTDRLVAAGVDGLVTDAFAKAAADRFASVVGEIPLSSLDTKGLVDTVEDRVVVPALLAAEGLPFDPVTLQHLIKASQDFLIASWTSSHPDFTGRIVFASCAIEPLPRMDHASSQRYAVVHHGRSYARPLFDEALYLSYERLAGSRRSYVSAYALRADVCTKLRIQPAVFSTCLDELMQRTRHSPNAIYTELPFQPPPKGESYVEVGSSRVGRLKVAR